MQRLKTRAQFQAVMAGSTVSRTAHFVLHRRAFDIPSVPESGGSAAAPRLPGTPAGPQSERLAALFDVCDQAALGALLPKRWAKRAVTRNAIKRQIYAVTSAIEPALPVAAHVVRLRAGFDRKLFPSATSDALKRAVRAELQELFARAAR